MRRQGTMDRGSLALFSLTAVFSLGLPHAAHSARFEHCGLDEVRYQVILLGSLGVGGGGADAINDHGQIVGATSISDAVGRAFIWDCANGMQNLGALGEDHFASLAYDINNRGEVVGQSLNEDITLAFIWDRTNGMRPIIEGDGLAYDINDWSEVILFGGGGTSYWTAAGGPRLVSDVVGFDITGDPFINNTRTIGGMRAIPDGDGPRFFNWNPRTGLRDLGLRPLDQPVSFMSGMNDRGDLIGTTFVTNGYVPFIVTREAEMQLLAAPQLGGGAQAGGINNRRQIVGTLDDLEGTTMRYVWDPRNGLRDLNELRVRGAPEIWRVNGINNWGWIAGSAVREDGVVEAALIVPVPERTAYFRKLGRLSGQKLCRALDALKAHAVVSCLLTGR